MSELTIEEYTQLSLGTWASRPQSHRRRNALLGICGEAGEAVDLIKKTLYHGKDFAEMRERMNGELGDLLYYAAMLAHEYGWKLDDILRTIVRPHTGFSGFEKAVNPLADSESFDIALRLSAVVGKLCSFALNEQGTTLTAMGQRGFQRCIGDIVFHIVLVAELYDLHLAEIARFNVDKLAQRHPNGWSVP